jgi:hypothetical protein
MLSRTAGFGQQEPFKIFAPMLTIPLPDELKGFIAERGLFEGFTRNDSPGYVELWSIENIPVQNVSIEIDRYAPGFLAFAGNGGGEVLAFDAAGGVYMLPLVGMEPKYAIKVADSFAAFAKTFELDVE